MHVHGACGRGRWRPLVGLARTRLRLRRRARSRWTAGSWRRARRRRRGRAPASPLRCTPGGWSGGRRGHGRHLRHRAVDRRGYVQPAQPEAAVGPAHAGDQQQQSPVRFQTRRSAGSTAAADWTGNYPPAQLGISKYGAGSLVFGSAITATDSTGLYTGSSGTVATLNNSNPGTSLTTGAQRLHQTAELRHRGTGRPHVVDPRHRVPVHGPDTYDLRLHVVVDGQSALGRGPSGSHIYVYLFGDGKPVYTEAPAERTSTPTSTAQRTASTATGTFWCSATARPLTRTSRLRTELDWSSVANRTCSHSDGTRRGQPRRLRRHHRR